jgi:hypothetical protein
MSKKAYEIAATKKMRSAMKERGVGYVELLALLEQKGITGETEASLKNKVTRGKFTFAFFMQCMHAMAFDYVGLEFPEARRKSSIENQD